jgi:peroxiredoxin
LSDAYSDAVFLGVNDESPTVIERTRRNLGLSFPSAYDSDGAIADLFGVRALPTTIVIDRNGLIVEAIEGFRRDGAVMRAIELARRGSVSLLNGHSDAPAAEELES